MIASLESIYLYFRSVALMKLNLTTTIYTVLLFLSHFTVSCSEGVSPPIDYDGLVQLTMDQDPPQDQIMEQTSSEEPVNQAPSNPSMQTSPMEMPSEDMSMMMNIPMDMDAPENSMMLEGDIPDGPPCDPRERAASQCTAGSYCVPVPGGRPHNGRCLDGDGCSLVGESSCPVETPYCHLHGQASVCRSEGTLEVGAPCVDDFLRPQPCAQGLVCNFSTCVPACDPQVTDSCPNEATCIDLSETINTSGGFCGSIGSCTLGTNTGCENEDRCVFGIRPDDRALITFCVPPGGQQVDEPCDLSVGSTLNCAGGLVCITTSNNEQRCKRLCDTGGYIAPCPRFQTCQELLGEQGSNQRLRGAGICITNP